MRCEPNRQGSHSSQARKGGGTARAQDVGKELAWEKYDTIAPHLRQEQYMRPVEQQVLQRGAPQLCVDEAIMTNRVNNRRPSQQ